jgi:hypothetical protein
MTHKRTSLFIALCFVTSLASAQDADKAQPAKDAPDTLPTIASKVEKLQKIDGYMPLYWQPSAGKLFMEIGRFNQEIARPSVPRAAAGGARRIRLTGTARRSRRPCRASSSSG